MFVFITGCSSIHYDNTPSVPGGYYTYCMKYPERQECGGTKIVQ